jgi:L-2,4-diaminobutyrate decarboxylase
VLAVEPQANIVCFRYVHPSLPQLELNLLNKRLRKSVLEEGSFYLVQTDLAGYTWLRTALMNPLTQLSDLEHLLGRIRQLANKELEKDHHR